MPDVRAAGCLSDIEHPPIRRAAHAVFRFRHGRPRAGGTGCCKIDRTIDGHLCCLFTKVSCFSRSKAFGTCHHVSGGDGLTPSKTGERERETSRLRQSIQYTNSVLPTAEGTTTSSHLRTRSPQVATETNSLRSRNGTPFFLYLFLRVTPGGVDHITPISPHGRKHILGLSDRAG